jgi:hypothetical protein
VSKIGDLLDMGENYNMAVFEAGMEYLERNCVAADVTRLSGDEYFWAWWQGSWDGRDKVILAAVDRGQLKVSELKGTWHKLHSGATAVQQVPEFIQRGVKA